MMGMPGGEDLVRSAVVQILSVLAKPLQFSSCGSYDPLTMCSHSRFTHGGGKSFGLEFAFEVEAVSCTALGESTQMAPHTTETIFATFPLANILAWKLAA